MKKLFACVVCFSLSALIAIAGGTEKTAKLEGSWTATGGVMEGKKLPEEVVTKLNLTVVIKDGKYNVSVMGKEIENGSYKIDAKAKPATIDLKIAKGKDEGKTQLGIFLLEGDKLTVAIASADSKERPKSFEGAEGVEVTMLKRNK
jgi:uncharacterized protein (TIGR03067 family)